MSLVNTPFELFPAAFLDGNNWPSWNTFTALITQEKEPPVWYLFHLCKITPAQISNSMLYHSTQISSSHSRQSWIDWMKMRHHLAWKNSTNVRHFRLIAGVHCPVLWPESRSGSLLPGGRHTPSILNQKPESNQRISFRFFFSSEISHVRKISGDTPHTQAQIQIWNN